MKATNIEGRLNRDGSIDLRFSTDVEVVEIGVAAESAHALLAVCLQLAPGDMTPEHDGFRLAELDGLPVLQFRFGQGRWLSIRLGPLDLETLESVLRDR